MRNKRFAVVEDKACIYWLSPERKEEILNYLAQKIDSFGLITPAIMALEAVKPLNLIASNFVLGISPIFKIFTDDKYSEEIVMFLEEDKNIEKLILKIEMIDEVRRAKEKEQKKRKNF